VSEKDATDGKGMTPEIRRYLDMWQRDPQSRVFAPLAEAYRKTGRIDRAIEICEKGLQIHPNYVSGRVALGRAYYDKGDYVSAKAQLEMVFEADPENLVAAKTLGEIYEKEGDLEKALLSYRLAHYSTPSAAEITDKVRSLEERLTHKSRDPAAVSERKKRELSELAGALKEAKRALRRSEARAAGEIDEEEEDPETRQDMEEEAQRLSSPPDMLDYDEEDEDEITLEMDLFFSEITPSEGEYGDYQIRPAGEAIIGAVRTRKPELVSLTYTELMLREGYIQRAVKVYEEFLQAEPENEQAVSRVAQLKEQLEDIKYEIRIREGEPGLQAKEEEQRKTTVSSLVDWLQRVKTTG